MLACLRAISEETLRDPTRIAVVMGESVLSYGTLDQKARSMAAALDELPDGVIGLNSLQGPQRAIAALGCLWAGRAFISLPGAEAVERTAHLAEIAKVSCVIGDRLPGCPSHEFEDMLSSTAMAAPVDVSSDMVAWISATSGSTGIPKCVPETRATAEAFTQLTIDEDLVRSDDVVATFGETWYHILFASLMVGARVEIYDVRRRGPTEVGRWMRSREITNFHSYSAMFRMVTANTLCALPHLRIACTFGEAVAPRELAGFNEIAQGNARFVHAYGSTEVGYISRLVYRRGDPIPADPVPVGKAYPGITVRVVGENKQDLELGTPGEVIVIGACIPDGYVGVEDGPFEELSDGRKSFRTGDLGVLDETGSLTLVGRSDDLVKIRGKQVFLKDVQRTIERHPDVKEVFVTAYARSDGEPRICAHVVSGAEISMPEITQFARRAGVEQPNSVLNYGALPRTRTGKVDRRALARPVAVDLSQKTYGADRWRLREIWADILGHDDFGDETEFADAGGDSLDAVEVLMRIEEKSGRKIYLDEALHEGFNITGLTRLLDKPASSENMVELSTTGSGKPIFVLPTAEDEFIHLIPLLRKFEKNHPVTAIRLFSPSDQTFLKASLSAFGGEAARRIAKRVPSSDVILMGFSFGAQLALETARHRLAMGGGVGGLILLDPTAQWVGRRPRIRTVVGPMLRGEGIRASYRALLALSGIQVFTDSADALEHAWNSYNPRALASAPPTLLVAAQMARRGNVMDAWRQIVGSETTVQKIDGTHTSFLLPTRVRRLWPHVTDWLNDLPSK